MSRSRYVRVRLYVVRIQVGASVKIITRRNSSVRFRLPESAGRHGQVYELQSEYFLGKRGKSSIACWLVHDDAASPIHAPFEAYKPASSIPQASSQVDAARHWQRPTTFKQLKAFQYQLDITTAEVPSPTVEEPEYSKLCDDFEIVVTEP